MRLSRKARKIADRVAGDDEDYDGFPAKQPHKHRKKYEQQRREHDRLLREAWSYYGTDTDYPF